MKAPSSSQGGATDVEQIARLRHSLLTSVNHILGLTEIQIDEASEIGLGDYVPAFAEINAYGRTLLAIIEGEFTPLSGLPDFRHLEARIESAAKPTLGQARKLAEQLHKIGSHSVAVEMDLVSSAVQDLLAISREMVQDLSSGKSAERLKR